MPSIIRRNSVQVSISNGQWDSALGSSLSNSCSSFVHPGGVYCTDPFIEWFFGDRFEMPFWLPGGFS